MSGTSVVSFRLFSSDLLDLSDMGVRASMSMVSTVCVSGRDRSCTSDHQSITAFGQLWGLVTCHSYGHHGMRVCFPIRQMLCVISQSISKNIERLSYAQRLHTRKLVRKLYSFSGGPLTPRHTDKYHALGPTPLWVHHIKRGRPA